MTRKQKLRTHPHQSPLTLVSFFRWSSPLRNRVSMCEVCRSLSFSFQSLITPTPLFMYSLYLQLQLPTSSPTSSQKRMKDLAEEAAADKIPDYPADYNNRGRSNSISFMRFCCQHLWPPLLCELVRILFVQAHRETASRESRERCQPETASRESRERCSHSLSSSSRMLVRADGKPNLFFAVSGVDGAQHNQDQFCSTALLFTPSSNVRSATSSSRAQPCVSTPTSMTLLYLHTYTLALPLTNLPPPIQFPHVL